LKFALIGGEAIDALLWNQLASSNATTYYNVYGPTECTVDAIACQVKGELAVPTIGKPLANVEAYVLDEQMGIVSIGLGGELYIGGDGLARGYLNRPDLTAERFVPHPFSTDAGARLYRTGDLVRYLADGNVEFIGRIDHQVKIRGYRIELGEIEAVLSGHAGVSDCVVMAREDEPGDKRLVAYLVADTLVADTLVADTESLLSIDEIRSYLKERLPDYMVPSAFVLLNEMPLTPNGKVDRRALPAPDGARPALADLYVEARTPVEEILAGIWREVLRVTRVGIHDNFFALGGHSLLATQVVSRIRQQLQVELPLRNIFSDPTVAGLADALIKCEATPGQVSALARLRVRIAQMSPDEIQAMLQDSKRLEVSNS
jgi:acyl carrier protein